MSNFNARPQTDTKKKTMKQYKEDIKAFGRGIRKVYRVTVGVIEALAWGVLVGIGWNIIYRTLKGEMALNDVLFAGVSMATIVISLRLLVEGAKYFRQIGNTYEN